MIIKFQLTLNDQSIQILFYIIEFIYMYHNITNIYEIK